MSDKSHRNVGGGTHYDACPRWKERDCDFEDGECICDDFDGIIAAAVAAAEQDARRDGYSQAMHDAFGDLSIEEYQRQIAQRNFDMGVTFALGAARDAVAAVVVQSRWGTTSHGLIGKGEALAAIDALEKP